MKNNKRPLLKTISRILLIASVVLFPISLTGPGSEFLWGFLKPLSALLFMNFFIMNLLANECVKYDEEQSRRLASARSASKGGRENVRKAVEHEYLHAEPLQAR